MAALGARVLKIEPTQGDVTRRVGPFFHDDPHPEKSGVFLYLNTSKESLTLNLDTAGGAALLKRLVPRADILVESYPPGTLAGWGLSYADLAPLNPGLIYASITDFGQTGPYRDYKGSEIVAEALGGLLYTMGLPDREPLKLAGHTALMTGGIAAFSAIMVALHQRDETGEGQYLDVSLMEATAVTQIHSSISAQHTEHDPVRHPEILSRAKDGWVNVGIQQSSWKAFCDLIGRPDLIDDPRFADRVSRQNNAAAIDEILQDWVAGRTKEEVYHTMQAIRSIAGYVADVADLLRSEQYRARGFFRPVDHPITGPLLYPGPAFQVGDLPWRQGPAPLLGEHNEVILHHQLGLPKDELARLREQGVI